MTRSTTRIVPLVVAVVTAGVVLRVIAGIDHEPELPTGALAYRATVGVPMSFRVDPADEGIVVALYLDAGRAGRPLRYTATLTVTDHDGGERWRGRAVIDAPPGAVGDGVRPLTAPRLLRVPDLDLRDVGRLTVVVEPSDDARAGAPVAIRVSRRALRPLTWRDREPANDVRTRAGGDLASVFGWAYLSDPELAVLHEEPTVRRAASVDPGLRALVTRVTSAAPGLPVPTVDDAGELIGPGSGAAWTVRGPGRIDLRVVGSGEIQLRTVDHLGAVTDEPITVTDGFDRGFAVAEAGALSVIVTHRRGASLWAQARALEGARPLGDAPAPPATGEIRPDRRRLLLWRVAPDGAPLRATLAGDGVARLIVRPVDDAVELAWRIVDPSGREIARGKQAVETPVAPLERYPEAAAHDPATLLAAAAPGSRLEVRANGRVDLGLEARGGRDERRLAPAWDLVLGAARVAYAPYLVRRWLPFRPDNHKELTPVSLEAQVRLEPAPPGLPPPGPYVAVEPVAPRVARVLVEEDPDPKGIRGWSRAGFSTDEDAALVVEEDRLVLDYLLEPSALGGRLTVLVDGIPTAERTVAFPRGRLRIDGVTPGPHKVRVEGAPGLVLAQARPAPREQQAPDLFAERRVWRLDRGASLEVPVHLQAGGRGKTLMFVIYTDDDPRLLRSLEAHVLIDGTERRVGLRSAGQATRLDRRVQKPIQGTEAYWLDGAGGPKGTATFGVWLGQDLGAGVHQVRVSLLGGPTRAHARFFVTGHGQPTRPVRALVEWEQD